jgi:hypothetical protein
MKRFDLSPLPILLCSLSFGAIFALRSTVSSWPHRDLAQCDLKRSLALRKSRRLPCMLTTGELAAGCLPPLQGVTFHVHCLTGVQSC